MRRLTEERDGRDGVARTADRLAPTPIATPPIAITRALATMRGSLDRPLSLETLAEVAGLSPFHFTRTFRQATGSPPGQFLAALRLERAKGLLLTTDLPVTEICFAVGYGSIGTFTTRFTQFVGWSPSRVRQLPDLLNDAVARLSDGPLAAPMPQPMPTTGVMGRIDAPAHDDAFIFVGLFPAAIPQCRPFAGTLLTAPGPFRLPAPPDGRYHLLAAALPHPRDPLACLLPAAALRVGRAAGTIHAHGGRCDGPTAITLRPPLPIDPPVLVALPALLLDACPWFGGDRNAR